jgi:hypothetical protein
MTDSHEIGDAPIEQAYIEQMNAVVRALDFAFNGDKHGDERETGFVLLVFPFGEKEGRCNYISNGADRHDIIALLREQLARFEQQT